jgi:hypothetical protein
MRTLLTFILGLILRQNPVAAQAIDSESPSAFCSNADGVIRADGTPIRPPFTPLTASERWRRYILGAYGPGAIARAAALGGINQWTGTPKEWGGGAESYGDRLGNALAKHAIEASSEHGAAALMHEDNRSVRPKSTASFSGRSMAWWRLS